MYLFHTDYVHVIFMRVFSETGESDVVINTVVTECNPPLLLMFFLQSLRPSMNFSYDDDKYTLLCVKDIHTKEDNDN